VRKDGEGFFGKRFRREWCSWNFETKILKKELGEVI